MPIMRLGYTHHPHAPRAQAVSSGDEAGLKPNDCAEEAPLSRPPHGIDLREEDHADPAPVSTAPDLIKLPELPHWP